MRWIALALLVVAPVSAQSIGERTGENQMLNRAPTGSDVLLGLHQFDLFQEGITDSSDKRGDAAVRNFAMAQSDSAEKRDKQLAAVQKKTGLSVQFPDEPDSSRSTRLDGLTGAVGERYLADFYEAEITEHASVVSLLSRYEAKPDNDDVRRLAEKEMPALQDSLERLRSAAPKK